MSKQALLYTILLLIYLDSEMRWCSILPLHDPPHRGEAHVLELTPIPLTLLESQERSCNQNIFLYRSADLIATVCNALTLK